jgi:hypothetical protein
MTADTSYFKCESFIAVVGALLVDCRELPGWRQPPADLPAVAERFAPVHFERLKSRVALIAAACLVVAAERERQSSSSQEPVWLQTGSGSRNRDAAYRVRTQGPDRRS